jgi:hypothetical protein
MFPWSARARRKHRVVAVGRKRIGHGTGCHSRPRATKKLPHDHNLPNRLNTTNFHTHGLYVSPDGIADNVLRDMEPGQTYEIDSITVGSTSVSASGLWKSGP